MPYGYWITPDGETHDIEGGDNSHHGDFILNNNLFPDEIAELQAESEAAMEQHIDYHKVCAVALKNGWLRTVNNPSGSNIQYYQQPTSSQISVLRSMFAREFRNPGYMVIVEQGLIDDFSYEMTRSIHEMMRALGAPVVANTNWYAQMKYGQ